MKKTSKEAINSFKGFLSRDLTRREFLKALVSSAAVLSVLPFAASQVFLVPKQKKIEDITIKIGNVNDLKPGEGKIFWYPEENAETPQFSNLLIRMKTAPDVYEFRAFNRVCTHLQCLVDYDSERYKMICPCHAGEYDPDKGTVISGPPPNPLPIVELKIDDNGDIWATGIKGVIGRGR